MDAPVKIAIPLAAGFEEVEAITLIDLLRRAGFDVTTFSITQELEVEGAHAIKVLTDTYLEEIKDLSFDAVILPGGMPGTLNLKASQELRELFSKWLEQGAAYGAICAAPTVLSAWGHLKGKNSTCYPGFENELVDSNFSEQAVVRDGNCITSRGVGTAIDYACAWVDYFLDEDASIELRSKILVT